MRTYLTTLGVLEGIWFTAVFLFACWGLYEEIKINKKRKFKTTFGYNFRKVFLDMDIISAYFVGVIIAFILSIPATWFVFIFKLGDKLLDKL
jgi:hypothetical protein